VVLAAAAAAAAVMVVVMVAVRDGKLAFGTHTFSTFYAHTAACVCVENVWENGREKNSRRFKSYRHIQPWAIENEPSLHAHARSSKPHPRAPPPDPG